jgi:hypothetical protein
MAAHAAKLAGADRVSIFSKRRKSELFGAQYLHSPIPGMTDGAPVTVRYLLKGSAEEYRRKVYGDQWDGTVSPEDLGGEHFAWDIRRTYNNLWERYGDYVMGTDISVRWLTCFMASEGKSYDIVVSSIPKPLLCCSPDIHVFRGQQIYVLGDAPERGLFVPDSLRLPANNMVVCSGEANDSWYRISKIFGYSTIEWPARPHDPRSDVTLSTLEKPLDNDCDCWAKILHVGRFGRWAKGVLSDSAFHSVSAALDGWVKL